MSRGGKDLYGTYGSVPTVENQGVSNAHQDIQVNANNFGGQVGEAISGLGAKSQQIGEHFGQMVTEAKVNDDYANKYVPAAVNLRQQYDSLRGPDKITGYDNYIKQLQELNQNFTASQPGLLGQRSMSALINRHITGEMEGAKRELVESQRAFSDQAQSAMIEANNGQAAQNYNNPDLVNSLTSQNDNHILIHHIDNGHDPNNPISQDMIKQAQITNRGDIGTGMINTAVSRGDAINANALRAHYADYIPGYVKLTLDNTLHAQNIQQTSTATVNAIKKGDAIPEAIGAPPSNVQALVANSAKSSSIDPNNALAVLRIESSNGKNLGTRGTLGQDKESAGKPIEDQAKALCDNLKNANQQATTALGRASEPWEGYVVYQQGAGGGPALLKASQDNPNAKAIDILEPLYKNKKDALSALNGNGGNITMSAGDFVNHIKEVYNSNAQRANCDFSNNTENPGEAITAPHSKTGPAVQPGSSPVQALMNFDNHAPDALAQINSISNYEIRDGVMKAYNRDRQRLQDGATAYKNVLVNNATKLAVDPKFTSMDQVPPDMQAALVEVNKGTLEFLEKQADYNLAKQSGMTIKDMREYGNGFYKSLNKIWNGEITNNAQLHDAVSSGELTIGGFDKLSNELKKSSSPEDATVQRSKKQFYDMAKQIIAPYPNPQKLQKFNDFYIQAEAAYNDGINNGKTSAQLLTSTSNDYLGKLIEPYKPTRNQIAADMVNNHTEESIRLRNEVNEFWNMPSEAFPGKAKETREKLSEPGIDDETRQRLTTTLLNLEIVADQRKLGRPRVNKIEPSLVPEAK